MRQSRTVTIVVKDRTLAQRLAAILELEGFHVNIALRDNQRLDPAPVRAAAAVEVRSIDVSQAASVTGDRSIDGTPLERPYGIGNIGRLAALH